MRQGQHMMVQTFEEETFLVDKMALLLRLRRKLMRKNPRRCGRWLVVDGSG